VNQHDTVTLGLGGVSANGTHDGTGSFAGTLTNYGRSVFGTCVRYSASISGSLTLTVRPRRPNAQRPVPGPRGWPGVALGHR
jgi:hypothetical protein